MEGTAKAACLPSLIKSQFTVNPSYAFSGGARRSQIMYIRQGLSSQADNNYVRDCVQKRVLYLKSQ